MSSRLVASGRCTYLKQLSVQETALYRDCNHVGAIVRFRDGRTLSRRNKVATTRARKVLVTRMYLDPIAGNKLHELDCHRCQKQVVTPSQILRKSFQTSEIISLLEKSPSTTLLFTRCLQICDVLRHQMQSISFPASFEPYVDADRAAAFLSISRKTLLALGRAGRVPGHPIGQGPRKTWRFRLSELSRWMEQKTLELDSHRGRN
jgi:hypothetical protein